MNDRTRRIFRCWLGLVGVITLSPWAQGAELLRSEVGNVSTRSFTVLLELSEPADVALRVFDAGVAGADVSGQLRYEWFPVAAVRPSVPGSRYGDRLNGYALQKRLRERGLVLVRVHNANPATQYYVEPVVTTGADSVVYPRLPVTTAARNAFITESRQIVVDLSAAGIDLSGTVVRLSHAGAPYPLLAVVSDAVGRGRAYADLNHFLKADGSENATFAGAADFTVSLRGYAADSLDTQIPFGGSGFTVAAATTVAFAIGGTPEVANFVFEPIGNQFAGVPFTITIRAVDAGGNIVTSFDGTADLTASAPLASGAGQTPAFSGGILVGHSVRIDRTGEQTLTATLSGGTVSGTSNPFLVQGLPGPWNLALEVNPLEAGSASGAGTFPHLSSVPVALVPNPGWRFLFWLGEGIEDPYEQSTNVTLAANTTLTAVLLPEDPEEDYTRWRKRYFLRNAENPDIASPQQDPNRNGLPNVLDYAFGLHPVLPNPERREPEFVWRAQGLTMIFHRRTNAPGLSTEIETAASLSGPWTVYRPPPQFIEITPVEPGVEKVEARLPGPADQPVFYRLKVILTDAPNP